MGRRFAIVIGVAAAGVMALVAQTAMAGGEPVDSVPPDLQLWGNEPDPLELMVVKQNLGKAVEVDVGCGDEACTLSGRGEVYWWVEDGEGKAATRSHENPQVKHRRLKSARDDLGPGETTTLSLKLNETTRENARNALKDKGEDVPVWSPYAEIIVFATDAAGNKTNAQAAIYFRASALRP
jgi:hypothetical protein